MFKKTCKNCGFKLDWSDPFCYKCGKSASRKYNDSDTIKETRYKMDPPGDLGCLMVFTYFIPFLGIFLGICLMFSKKKSKKDDGFMVLCIGLIVVLVECLIFIFPFLL